MKRPSDPPDQLCDEDHNSLVLWALKHHPELSEAELLEAAEIVFDWARSSGKQKCSWVATIRNAIRLGWALPQNAVGTNGKNRNAQPRLTFEEEQGARRKQALRL